MVGAGRDKRNHLTRKPHFFKVLVGDFAQRLKIPPNFVKHWLEEASERVILHDPSGKTWNVGLEKNVNGTFFSNGWKKFVNDHSLNEHEFLVFQYDGNTHFSVLMFDITACEKEDVFCIKISQEENGCQGEGEQVIQPKCSSNDRSKTKEEPQDLCYTLSKDIKKAKGGISGRSPVAQQERLKAKKSASYSFFSTFPSFSSRMTASSMKKPYMLRVPVRFSRAHLPSTKTVLVLRDPSGKVWNVVHIAGYHCYLSRGWIAFARGNDLKEGDFCVFELVSPLEFRMSFFKMPRGTEC